MTRRKRAIRRILIIAGPNGAGKTTFAGQYLTQEANCPEFINADLIARGISPFDPQGAAFEAGRVMLERIEARVTARRSFAFETTLSGLTYARYIPEWQAAGYHVTLIFLNLRSVDIALARIRARVAQGGHDMPESVVRRRFGRGLRNLETVYRHLVNSWVVYDNSGPVPKLIDSGGREP